MRRIPLVRTAPQGFLTRLAEGVPRLLDAQPLARYLPGISATARRFLPDRFVPCMPMTAPRPPSGPLWLHEIKHDGVRIVARKVGDRVRLFNRHGHDLTKRFPLVVDAVAALREPSCLIDAEAVPPRGEPPFVVSAAVLFEKEEMPALLRPETAISSFSAPGWGPTAPLRRTVSTDGHFPA